MNNNGTPFSVAALPFVPPDWDFKAAADFDHAGSGNADILWQNDHGALALWQMEAATVAAVHALPNPGPTWHVVGDNDFNADIADDISLPERQWSGGDLDRHQRVGRQTWVVRRRGIPARHREWLGGAGPLGGEGRRLGWVQQVSDRPDAVAETDTQFYGVGAFLLAASAAASITEG